MRPKRISISDSHFNKNILTYVQDAFLRNEISSYGNNINKFEESLEQYLGDKKHIAALSTGTSAIHLALVQLGVGLDDEVICQTFTFCGSVNPIIYQGAKPVFVDSEKDTWNMCPNNLEEAIKDRIRKNQKPKAIILVHLYGMPAKIDEILNIAKKYQIPVVEDAAEALGSSYKDRKCGTFGDYSILSFNGNKVITTSGGGALVCNTEEQKNETIFYATQARDNAAHYQHSKVGYNYRMSNVSAGIGRGQIQVLDKYIELRRTMNQFYKTIFQDIECISVFQEPNEDYFSNHWLSCILFDRKCKFTRQEFQDAMNLANIETRPLWKPMHLQPIFKQYPYYGKKVSETLFRSGLCLPSGSNLTDEDRQRISSVINQFK